MTDDQVKSLLEKLDRQADAIYALAYAVTQMAQPDDEQDPIEQPLSDKPGKITR